MTENIYGVIYCLTNEVNGKQYFGQTTENIEKYWNNYKNISKRNFSRVIYRAIRKYGWDNFDKNVFCECGDKLSLGLMEDFCIQVFDTLVPNGYNLRRGGVHGKVSKERKKWTEKQKQAQSIKMKEWYKNHPEAMKGENHPMWGKIQSEKTRKLMSENHADVSGENNPFYGRKHSEKIKQKIRDNMPDMSGENHWNYGKTTSEETKQKIKDHHADVLGENHWNYGKTTSEETKQLQSIKRKEYLKNHPEAMKGENALMFGKIVSEETKQKRKKTIESKLEIFCQYCNKKYKFLKSLKKHEKDCKLRENK